jgi:hypothetical protein
MRAALSSRRLSVAALLALLLALLVVSPLGAAMLSPAFALIAALLFGAFPSDRLILAIRRRLRRRRVAAPLALRPRPAAVAPRRSAPLGFALAVRPPPVGVVFR